MSGFCGVYSDISHNDNDVSFTDETMEKVNRLIAKDDCVVHDFTSSA
jgi:hypothetical protein